MGDDGYGHVLICASDRYAGALVTFSIALTDTRFGFMFNSKLVSIASGFHALNECPF